MPQGVTAAKCFVCKCEAIAEQAGAGAEGKERVVEGINTEGRGGDTKAQLLVRSSELLAQLSIMAAHWL